MLVHTPRWRPSLARSTELRTWPGSAISSPCYSGRSRTQCLLPLRPAKASMALAALRLRIAHFPCSRFAPEQSYMCLHSNPSYLSYPCFPQPAHPGPPVPGQLPVSTAHIAFPNESKPPFIPARCPLPIAQHRATHHAPPLPFLYTPSINADHVMSGVSRAGNGQTSGKIVLPALQTWHSLAMGIYVTIQIECAS